MITFAPSNHHEQMAKSTLVGHLAAAGAYTIFGLNIVFCKDIANSEAVTPIALFSLRAVGATALFWLISLFMPKEKMAKGDLWKTAVASFFGLFLTQYTFLSAITMATPLDASIISTLSPIFTMLIASLVIKEPITFKKAAGVAISFAGVLYLILNTVSTRAGATQTSPWGIVLLLANSLSFATYLGVFRPLISRYNVITFMKWMFLFALLISLPFSARDLATTDFAAIPVNVRWEIGFLIFFATFVAYFLVPVGQKHIRPTLVSMYSYLQPIIAATIAIAVGMDALTWQKVAATVLVISGVVIVNRSRSKAA